MKKQLIKSSYYRTLEISISTILSLLLTPYLIHHLGNENYGLWILVLSTMGWFSFIDLGFSYTVQRSIVLALGEHDEHRINVVFSVAIVLFSVLGAIAALCMILLALFPELLGVKAENQEMTSIVLVVLAIKIFFDFVMGAFHGFYTAYLRMDIDANLSSFNTLIKAILVYILIIDINIYGAVLATMVADLCSHSLKVYYKDRKFKHTFQSINRKISIFGVSDQ